MTTTTTYDWLKHIPSALLKSDEVPSQGNPPPFPWDGLASKISEIFSLKDLKIEAPRPIEPHPSEDALKGFGVDPVVLSITLVPNLPPLLWIVASEDIQQLMSIVLSIEPEKVKEVDAEFRQGFYQFLAIEVLNIIPQLEFDKTLAPHLQKNADIPKETMHCLDVSIASKQKTIWGRLLLSNSFRKAWLERYTPRTMDIPRPILQYLDVTVHFEAGKTSLSLSEWTKVSLGDFLILDSCSLKPNGEGRIILTMNGFPIFRGKIKDGNIKILEHPLYHEEEMTTNENNAPNNHEEYSEDQELEDEDLLLDEFEEEEFEEEIPEEEPPQPPAQQVQKATPPEPQAQAVQQTPPAPSAAPSQKVFSAEEIPFSIVVEVGRVQMSLQKLMELQPGHLLELNIRPENGVDLVVNGKRIAKGELLLIGEALGVRILDIG